MSLSCSCESDDDGYGWWYFIPKEYTTLQTNKRKRCSSCKTLIEIGATCLEFKRSRPPRNEIEESIYNGCDIPLASMRQCESCADMFFNLRELGFECVSPDENMESLAQEYREVYLKKENNNVSK